MVMESLSAFLHALRWGLSNSLKCSTSTPVLLRVAKWWCTLYWNFQRSCSPGLIPSFIASQVALGGVPEQVLPVRPSPINLLKSCGSSIRQTCHQCRLLSPVYWHWCYHCYFLTDFAAVAVGMGISSHLWTLGWWTRRYFEEESNRCTGSSLTMKVFCLQFASLLCASLKTSLTRRCLQIKFQQGLWVL